MTQITPGFLGCHVPLKNAAKLNEVAGAGRFTSKLWITEPLEVHVAYSGCGQRRGKGRFGKPSSSRNRQLADINQ
jgi:hypothetical protein